MSCVLSVDRKLDEIFDKVDELCWAGDFDEIDRLLVQEKPERDIVLRLGWLTITISVKSRLKNRRAFFDDTKSLLEGNPERDGLLRGLE